jgi:hypothetical protein
MWRITTALLLAFLAWTLLTPTGHTQTRPRLEGLVKDGTSQPVSGLTVQLVPSSAGRNQSTVTDLNGHFCFEDVVSGSYSLQVYWGRTLMYRQPVRVDRDVQWPDIVLD